MFEVWADGSVRGGNPGIGGIGIYIEHNGTEVFRYSALVGEDVTSNQVEYAAVMFALKHLYLINIHNESCKIHTDSALVHGHVIKGWKCNFEHLRKLRDEVKELIETSPYQLELSWSCRMSNEVANELAQAVTEEEKLARRG